MKKWIWLGIVAVIIVAGALYFGKNFNKPNSQIWLPPPPNQVAIIPQTETYNNKQFGFGFEYPTGLHMDVTASDKDGLQVLFSVVGPHNLASSTVDVNVVISPQLVANCLIAPPPNAGILASDVGTTSIHGVPFFSFRRTIKGPYLILTKMYYNTLRESKCYILSYSMATAPSNTLNSSQAAMKPSDQNAVEQEIHQIIQSFRFTNTTSEIQSETTIVNWTSYQNNNLGIQFLYPPEYEKPQEFAGTEISLWTQNQVKRIEIIREPFGTSCFAGFCNAPAKKQLIENSLVWDDVGAPHAIDINQEDTYEGWRTTIGNCHYYAYFVNETRQSDFLSHITIQSKNCKQ